MAFCINAIRSLFCVVESSLAAAQPVSQASRPSALLIRLNRWETVLWAADAVGYGGPKKNDHVHQHDAPSDQYLRR